MTSTCLEITRAQRREILSACTLPRLNTEQVVLVGILDQHIHNVTGLKPLGIAQVDLSVDLWCICLRPASSAAFPVRHVYNDRQGAAYFCLQLCRADRSGFFHDTLIALFLYLFRHCVGQGVGCGALYRFEAEGADTIKLRFIKPIEQILEIRLSLARKADNEAGTDRNVRANLTPTTNAFQHLGLIGGALHGLEHGGRRMLEGNVEIGVMSPSAISGTTSFTCG